MKSDSGVPVFSSRLRHFDGSLRTCRENGSATSAGAGVARHRHPPLREEYRFLHCRHHRSAHADQCGAVACGLTAEAERCFPDERLVVLLPQRSDAVGRFGKNDPLPFGGMDGYSRVCVCRDEDQPKNRTVIWDNPFLIATATRFLQSGGCV